MKAKDAAQFKGLPHFLPFDFRYSSGFCRPQTHSGKD
jgi:hypothetical protein